MSQDWYQRESMHQQGQQAYNPAIHQSVCQQSPVVRYQQGPNNEMSAERLRNNQRR